MQKTSFKTKLLNYVESLGRPAAWKEIHSFIINQKIKDGKIDEDEYKANPSEFRGYYSHNLWIGSPFEWSKPGYLRRPSKCDKRYLDKNDVNKWIVVA